MQLHVYGRAEGIFFGTATVHAHNAMLEHTCANVGCGLDYGLGQLSMGSTFPVQWIMVRCIQD